MQEDFSGNGGIIEMKVKMIVTDLDFTVLHSDRSVSEYTGKVFAECRRQGF